VTRLHVGVQLHPQHCSVADLRRAWRAADELGVDSIWLWDHFFPLYGERDGRHYEGWTLLAAMAADTTRARVGMLVTCNSYRNPELLADMARTLDHLSDGRAILGIGAGWFERDYTEYGYEFGTPGSRLADLAEALPRIHDRLGRLNPPPVQSPLPVCVGGGGEKKTLRLVAEHATMWNSFGPPGTYARKNRILDEHCTAIGRDPGEIERTCAINDDVRDLDPQPYVDAGATHLIAGLGAPFDLTGVRALLERTRG
jgi:probable F420-dependent oxidoreductase